MLNNQDKRLKQKFQEYEIYSQITSNKYNAIIGIDEVGRGSLAGPLVVGYFGNSLNKTLKNFLKTPIYCHCYTKDYGKYSDVCFNDIRDSKNISAKQRIYLFKKINEIFKTPQFNLGKIYCSATLIDKYKLGACLRHVLYIISKINVDYFGDDSLFLLDGNLLMPNELNLDLFHEICKENNIKIKIDSNFTINSYNIIKGDDKYFNIASASIIAKVDRDEYMNILSKKYPIFGWGKNKGYGTKANIEAIINNKCRNEHLRKSFLSKYI